MPLYAVIMCRIEGFLRTVSTHLDRIIRRKPDAVPHQVWFTLTMSRSKGGSPTHIHHVRRTSREHQQRTTYREEPVDSRGDPCPCSRIPQSRFSLHRRRTSRRAGHRKGTGENQEGLCRTEYRIGDIIGPVGLPTGLAWPWMAMEGPCPASVLSTN